MKIIAILLFTTFSMVGYSQNIFEYEQEISNKEKYHFYKIEFPLSKLSNIMELKNEITE